MAAIDETGTAPKQPQGSSLTIDAGAEKYNRGAAGIEGGPRVGGGEGAVTGSASRGGDLEERRETQQVVRPTTDGVGEGLVKDAG